MHTADSTARRDIIVIGGSAGGHAPLVDAVRLLPKQSPVAVFIVMHTSPENPGSLERILDRLGTLPAAYARDGEAITPGRIYIAPPDRHLLLKRGFVRVTRGPKENSFRPAVDPLFRTASRAYGARVVGVVLSGGLNDGSLGLMQIVAGGGVAVVQDPDEALVPTMPLSAIRSAPVHHVLPAVALGPALAELSGQIVPQEETDMPADEPDIAEVGDSLQNPERPGTPSAFTCPECHGALWELSEGSKLLRFRCHVGHGFTAESLLAEQQHTLEETLWSALRALEENAALLRRLSARAGDAGLHTLPRRYGKEAREMERRAGVLRDLLQREEIIATPQPDDAYALERQAGVEAPDRRRASGGRESPED